MDELKTSISNELEERCLFLLVTILIFLIGFWLHIPYGGGHIYSDIVSVYQVRLEGFPPKAPYAEVFFEYPVITAALAYVSGLMASLLTKEYYTALLLYYTITSAILFILTFLTVSEVRRLCGLFGVEKKRIYAYLIITPSMLFMNLLNWYILGVYFMIRAIRLSIEGRITSSGIFLGISAASNFITAIPSVAILMTCGDFRRKIRFIAAALITYFLVNLPAILLNPRNWLSFWEYHASWYVECNWQILFFDMFDPNARALSAGLMPMLLIMPLIVAHKTSFQKHVKIILASWLVMAWFLFANYVYTPQMNIMLLPFFTLLAVAPYPLFIIFEVLNSAIIVVGFSGFIQNILGIKYTVEPWGIDSPIQWMAIARSFLLLGFILYSLYVIFRKSSSDLVA
ncbi:MAG: hypothetical protein NZ931_02200 [Aigarchaeota archaeon]|nr:hypothetical protein [Aigarchaeota archaeon]